MREPDFTFDDLAFLKIMHITPGDPELASREDMERLLNMVDEVIND